MNTVEIEVGEMPRLDIALGLDRMHHRGTDEALEGEDVDRVAVGDEMKRRVEMGARMQAHRHPGGIVGVAAAHAAARDELERRGCGPAHGLSGSIERYIVILH